LNHRRKLALITGISGQDGAYLAKTLLSHGYEVHGASRSLDPGRTDRLSAVGVLDQVSLHTVNLLDPKSVSDCLLSAPFTHIFNLAALSSVARSFEDPAGTISSIIIGTHNLLQAVEQALPSVRFVNASSGESFGTVHGPADEDHPLLPRSPYGIAKAATHWLTGQGRARGHHFSSAIMFNHESPLRPPTYVTKKIIAGVIGIHRREIDQIILGNLDVVRDWGYAPEYVEALRMMGEYNEARDFVVATGHAFSLTEFVITAFDYFGMDWRKHVRMSPELLRPADIAYSVGNPAEIKRRLGWAASCKGKLLVERLIEAELSGSV
jgi:GDPmannose 4,6-dehydratase